MARVDHGSRDRGAFESHVVIHVEDTNVCAYCSSQPQPTRDFLASVHAPEYAQAGSSAAHRFEVKLVPAKATQEAFELYDRYQISVHGDKPGHNSMTGFQRFLCRNPLGVSVSRLRLPGIRAADRFARVETTHTLPQSDTTCASASPLWLLSST